MIDVCILDVVKQMNWSWYLYSDLKRDLTTTVIRILFSQTVGIDDASIIVSVGQVILLERDVNDSR